MLTVPAPDGCVNPAELPVADAVLEAACIELHDPQNYNRLYQVLAPRHPNLAEEIHFRMRTGPFAGAAVMAVVI